MSNTLQGGSQSGKNFRHVTRFHHSHMRYAADLTLQLLLPAAEHHAELLAQRFSKWGPLDSRR